MLSQRDLAAIDDYSLLFTLDSFHEQTSHKVFYKKPNLCPINRQIMIDFRSSKLSLDDALHKILKIERVRTCLYRNLRNIQPDFIEHIRSYLSALHEDSNFDIVPDQDPTVKVQSFKVIAKKDIKQGTKLTALCGRIAEVDQCDNILMEGINDFSLMCVDNLQCWLLGPVSFVNHTCQNDNAKYCRQGRTDRVYLIMTQHVKMNDEILVRYGKQYFEGSHKKCLCVSCKKETLLKKTENRITRSKAPAILQSHSDNIIVKPPKRFKKKRCKSQKRFKVPSQDDPFPCCPGTTLMQNIPIKVVDHELHRGQVSVRVLFLSASSPIQVNLKTLLELIDGKRLIQDYLKYLYYREFPRWSMFKMVHPELDQHNLVPRCQNKKPYQLTCPKKINPQWYINVVPIGKTIRKSQNDYIYSCHDPIGLNQIPDRITDRPTSSRSWECNF